MSDWMILTSEEVSRRIRSKSSVSSVSSISRIPESSLHARTVVKRQISKTGYKDFISGQLKYIIQMYPAYEKAILLGMLSCERFALNYVNSLLYFLFNKFFYTPL